MCVTYQDDVCESQAVRVRDREMRPRGAESGKMAGRGIVKVQLRWTAVADDFEILPQHSEGMAGANRFHSGFLRRKAAGEVRCGILASHAVLELARGKDAAQKTLAIALDSGRNSFNLGRIHAEADDGHDRTLQFLKRMAIRDMAISTPVPADGFAWATAPWGLKLVALALEDLSHGWTTSQLQLRGSADVERSGWTQVAAAAGVPLPALIRLHQVHGINIHRASTADVGARPKEADIIRTDDADVAVAVQVADCVPLLLGNVRMQRVAAAHAGWRGTAANAAGIAVAEFTGHHESALVAAIGPSIGPCCYRVGPELRSSFESLGWSSSMLDRWFSSRGGALYLDLWQANADQLRTAGVQHGNIHVSRLCTSCHPEWFYSYRRDGAGTGRMVGFIRSVASLSF